MNSGLLARDVSRVAGRALLLSALAWLAACDTPVRVPGLSLAFPDTAPGFTSARPLSEAVTILPSVDVRPGNLGREVANSGWMACKADTLRDGALPKLVDERVSEALAKANIFASVRTEPTAPWTLATDIQVFCSQTRGFIGRRVAGLVAMKFTLRKGDAVFWQQSYERVVTDADADYTGSFVTTVEQGMRRSMADSFRLVLRDALRQMDAAIPRA